MAAATVEPHDDYVMRTVEERGVRYVRLWFVDVLGLLKSFAIPVSELEQALEEGVGIDGSALEGSSRMREQDVIARPDARTFQILPWRPESLVGRMFCDMTWPDGSPHPGDSRAVLGRVLGRAADLGFSCQVGPEIEFFLFAEGTDGARPQPLDDGAYFDLTPLDVGSDFRRRAIEYLEEMSIPVKASHHEVGASQHEMDLQHTDALTMADSVITFRMAVKEVAREAGVYATFMPKPLEEEAGSAMHLHLSLLGDRGNAFYPSEPDEPLSAIGRSFLAGVLDHAGEVSAVTNQWINSYKRICGGYEAPGRVSWSRQGESTLVRVPTYRPGRDGAARLELRSPDPACNPYLAFALVLAAGLDGVERELDPPPELDDATPVADLPRLPSDLREAADAFERSKLARDTLGDVLCEWFLRTKRAEWDEYRRTVTEFERGRLLRIL